jgi:hypothetical protein
MQVGGVKIQVGQGWVANCRGGHQFYTIKKTKHFMKTPLRLLSVLALLLVFALFSVVSCQKEINGGTAAVTNPSGQQKIQLFMNDHEDFNFTKVLVDIRRVEIKIDTGRHHDDDYYDDDKDDDDDHHGRDGYGYWDTLNVRAGIYDLLRLRNGIDTLLADGFTANGHISKIRITLGTNNSVWKDSVQSYPLTLCDKSPYVYVRINSNTIDSLPGGGVRINIDFDVQKSIKGKRSNTEFCLKPVIKSYAHHNSGELEGKVFPRAANPVVTVYNATDTATARPDREGEFKIKGLKPAVYSVKYSGDAPYKDTTLTNITVKKGDDTKLPTITLKQ